MKLSKTLLAIVAALAVAGFASQAHATAITGMLNLAGTATFNTNHLGSATSVTSFTNVTAGDGNSGAFAGISAGTPITMSAPYIFNPSTPTPALWSVNGFTFDLQTSHVDFQSNSALDISGTGTIFGPGFTPTAGEWEFTSQAAGGHPGSTFTFSANVAGAHVPDGGMTVTLLGAALVGLAGLRAKFGKN